MWTVNVPKTFMIHNAFAQIQMTKGGNTLTRFIYLNESTICHWVTMKRIFSNKLCKQLSVQSPPARWSMWVDTSDTHAGWRLRVLAWFDMTHSRCGDDLLREGRDRNDVNILLWGERHLLCMKSPSNTTVFHADLESRQLLSFFWLANFEACVRRMRVISTFATYFMHVRSEVYKSVNVVLWLSRRSAAQLVVRCAWHICVNRTAIRF